MCFELPMFSNIYGLPIIWHFFLSLLDIVFGFQGIAQKFGTTHNFKLFPWLLNLEKNPTSSFFLFWGAILMGFLSLRGTFQINVQIDFWNAYESNLKSFWAWILHFIDVQSSQMMWNLNPFGEMKVQGLTIIYFHLNRWWVKLTNRMKCFLMYKTWP